MKSYPSIGTVVDRTHIYHVFDKLDGLNIRAEWSAKRGFYKFGPRTQLITGEQVMIFPSIEKIMTTYGATLGASFARRKITRAVAFFEYAGPNSFAGSHPDPVDRTGVTLFDIAVHQRGSFPLRDF